MSSVPVAMGRAPGGRGSNPGNEGPEDYRRDRHGIPISAVPVSHPHLTHANALQYQFRPGDAAAAPLLYRVVPPSHDHEGALQSFPGSQLFGQSTNSNNSNSSPNNHDGGERFPFQYATATASNDSNGQRSLVRGGGGGAGQFAVAAAAATTKSAGAVAAAAVGGGVGGGGVGGGGGGVGDQTLPRSTRDERRRATHNEVERRRRDKINNWIVTLSKIVPDCVVETTNNKGSLTQTLNAQSKGGILAKTVEYITELKMINTRMAEQLKDNENINLDIEILRQQMEELKSENSLLRNTLVQHGINIDSS